MSDARDAQVPAESVVLSIDELVVDGTGPSYARRFGEALERRLAQLLDERGVPPSLGGSVELPTLGLAARDLRLDGSPERAGAVLAETLFARLGEPLPSAAGALVAEPSRRAPGSSADPSTSRVVGLASESGDRP